MAGLKARFCLRCKIDGSAACKRHRCWYDQTIIGESEEAHIAADRSYVRPEIPRVQSERLDRVLAELGRLEKRTRGAGIVHQNIMLAQNYLERAQLSHTCPLVDA